jgi:F-type H+-transporting ATPase subunit gamma
MESLEQLQKQLASLDDLRSIVKTMKAMSAANIRQYEQAVDALAGYYATVKYGLQAILREQQQPLSPVASTGAKRRLAAIVFGSDHGMCGRFNEEIADYARQRIAASAADPQAPLILATGERVATALASQGQAVAQSLPTPAAAAQITLTVQQILLQIDTWREQEGVHYVYLFYNRHTGSKNQHQPTGIELLPLNLQRFHRLQEEPWPSRSLPTFSMQPEVLLSRLIRQYLFVLVFRACAESQASEHASRLAAMQAAQRNLDEQMDDVSMAYRRARQNAITAELLDVVAGFEASNH